MNVHGRSEWNVPDQREMLRHGGNGFVIDYADLARLPRQPRQPIFEGTQRRSTASDPG